VNGVARGGFYSTSQVLNVRCGGLRWERVRTYTGDRVGFRCEWCAERWVFYKWSNVLYESD